LFGAILLAYGRLPGQRIPHEAIIGVVYVVAAAATVLLLSKSPHGHEQMEEMLTGKLLFVDRDERGHRQSSGRGGSVRRRRLTASSRSRLGGSA
jgi:hypothetical protein